jgi:hypothetical protein
MADAPTLMVVTDVLAMKDSNPHLMEQVVLILTSVVMHLSVRTVCVRTVLVELLVHVTSDTYELLVGTPAKIVTNVTSMLTFVTTVNVSTWMEDSNVTATRDSLNLQAEKLALM